MFDHVLNVDENTFWAANDEDGDSTNRLRVGIENLMYNTHADHSSLDGKNFGLQRINSTDCDPKKYAGLG